MLEINNVKINALFFFFSSADGTPPGIIMKLLLGKHFV